jgi:hypothetical protein
MVVVHLLTETFPLHRRSTKQQSSRGREDLIALTLQKATAALYLKPTGISAFSMSSTSQNGYATPRLNYAHRSKEESSCLWSISRVISGRHRTDTCS